MHDNRNLDILELLIKSNKYGKSSKLDFIKILKPNLKVFEVFVDEFEKHKFVIRSKVREENKDNYDFPVVMAKQVLFSKPKELRVWLGKDMSNTHDRLNVQVYGVFESPILFKYNIQRPRFWCSRQTHTQVVYPFDITNQLVEAISLNFVDEK